MTATSTVTLTATPEKPDFGNFLRDWSGHTRSVYLTHDGVMTELINDGCCELSLVLVLQLPDPSGTADAASANAVVVAHYPQSGDVPQNGDQGTVTIRNGVMTDSIDDVTYCDTANSSITDECGA